MKEEIKSIGTGPQTHFFYTVVSCDPEILASDGHCDFGTFTSKAEAEAKCNKIGCAKIDTISMDDETYNDYINMMCRKECDDIDSRPKNIYNPCNYKKQFELPDNI